MAFELVFSYKCMFVSRGQIIHVVFFDGLKLPDEIVVGTHHF